MPIDLQQYLEDFETLPEAYAAYVADCAALVESGNSEAGLALQWASGLQSVIPHLVESIGCGYGSPDLDSQWRPEAFVFVGNAHQKLFTQSVGSCSAVLIDYDLALRLALLVFAVGFDREQDIAIDGLTAFLLLSIVVPRDEAFPHLYEIVECFAQLNSRALNDVLLITGKFILFHELGHVYAREYSTDFLKFTFEVRSQEATNASTESLLSADRLQQWRSEFAADVFAAYASVLTGAAGKPRTTHLDIWASALTCWQVLLFALGHRQQYMRMIAGDTGSADFSHPIAEARMDMLVHHLDSLAEIFAPEWQSETITLLREQYESLWATDLKSLMRDAIEFVRYGFDEDGPDINVGRVFSASMGPVKANPSALTRLGKSFLTPLLRDATRVGWDRAVQMKAEQFEEFFDTFRLSRRPVCILLGRRMRAMNLRLVSLDRS